MRDFPSDQILTVGHIPEVRLRRIEDLKGGTDPAEKGAGDQKTFLRWVLIIYNQRRYNMKTKTG